MLEEIWSGGQTGVDIAALEAARSKGVNTGGWMPKGWITQDGPRPEYEKLYGLREHHCGDYRSRTWQNVCDTCGTLRIARDMQSAGERCTLRAITASNRPYFDVDASKADGWLSGRYHTNQSPRHVAYWILSRGIIRLNVAGNSDRTAPGIGLYARDFIERMIEEFWLLSAPRNE
jgi:hypothetical protein